MGCRCIKELYVLRNVYVLSTLVKPSSSESVISVELRGVDQTPCSGCVDGGTILALWVVTK